MRCRHASRWIRENLPDRLEEIPEKIRRHVAGCRSCQEVWERQRRIAEALAAMPAPEPPARLRTRVVARLGQRRRSRLPAWQWATAVTAVVLLLAIGGLRGRGPGVLMVTHDDLGPSTYLQQHTTMVAADPLTDPTALNAYSLLMMREAAWRPAGDR